MNFTDDLSITVTLKTGGSVFNLPGGNIKGLTLSLQPYGYTGSVDFLVSNEPVTDALLSPFCQDGLMEVSLAVSTYIDASEQTVEALNLTGLVTTRGFTEQTSINVPMPGDPVLLRHYYLEFADTLQVLWKQHFPCDLMVNSTLSALLSAHTPSSVTLQCNWDLLEQSYSILALPLGYANNRASFYDFVMWLTDTHHGVFSYDYTSNSYSLSKQKTPMGTPNTALYQDILECRVDFPEIPRYQPRVLNAYSGNPQTSAIANAQAVAPLYHDYINIYPVAADVTTAVNLQTARFNLPKYQVCATYGRFPAQANPPGQALQFSGNYWSQALYLNGNSYRVRDWNLCAVAVESESALIRTQPFGRYHMQFSQQLETGDELRVALPAYTPPAYPFFVEGIVYSDQGEATDTGYQFIQDQNTSANYYQAKIPLWNNILIQLPFTPNFLSGQFYFPLTNNAVVSVGLNFTDAFIAGIINWGGAVNVPMSSQGNQLVMGQSASSQTTLTHAYVNSLPQLQLQRMQGSDTELLQFSDGSILLRTQEQSGSQGQGG